MTSGAMAVVVVPFGFAKAGFFSGCPAVLPVMMLTMLAFAPFSAALSFVVRLHASDP